MLKEIIHFYKSNDLTKVIAFYSDILGLPLYKDQGSCLIYQLHTHSHIGFCLHHPTYFPASTCITFVYDTKEEVDSSYQRLSKLIKIEHLPSLNPTFQIYHFFCQDFEGRTIEIQTFLEDTHENTSLSIKNSTN
jgi:hypothetical protein